MGLRAPATPEPQPSWGRRSCDQEDGGSTEGIFSLGPVQSIPAPHPCSDSGCPGSTCRCGPAAGWGRAGLGREDPEGRGDRRGLEEPCERKWLPNPSAQREGQERRRGGGRAEKGLRAGWSGAPARRARRRRCPVSCRARCAARRPGLTACRRQVTQPPEPLGPQCERRDAGAGSARPGSGLAPRRG